MPQEVSGGQGKSILIESIQKGVFPIKPAPNICIVRGEPEWGDLSLGPEGWCAEMIVSLLNAAFSNDW